MAKAILLIFLLSCCSSAIWGGNDERKPDISAILVHVSKLSIVFREVTCDFNNSEELAPFSNTCANFCVLQDACDDLSSDIRMYVNAVISKFVIRLMKYQEFHELSTYQELLKSESGAPERKSAAR